MGNANAKNKKSRVQEIQDDEVPMVELAKLSHLAYLEWNNGIGAMTQDEHYIELVAGGQYSVVSQNWITGGLTAKTYIAQWTVFKRSNLIIIAVKGTAGARDLLVEDLQAIVGGQYPRKMIDDLTKVVQEQQVAGCTVMITGHSLGGYAAEIISTTLNIAGAGFQAPGPNSSTVGSKHDGSHKHPGFRCINAYHDPIGNLMPGIFAHLQWTVYADSSDLCSLVPLRSHRITNMVSFLEDCTSEITNYNVYEYATVNMKKQYILNANTAPKKSDNLENV